jgi:hypothetical protein
MVRCFERLRRPPCVCLGESDLQEDGRTALMWATVNGHVECLRLLIDARANKEAKDKVRRRILLECCAFFFLGFRYFIFSSMLL